MDPTSILQIAQFFVAHQSQPIDLLLLSLLLSVLVPAAIVVVRVAALPLGSRLQRGLQSLLVALLATCVALPLFGRIPSLPGVICLAAHY